MALPPVSCLVLRECEMEEAKLLGGDLAKKEKVDYDNGPNIQWYIFGDGLGHGALIKIGRPDKPSSHWRVGRIWLSEKARGQGALGFFYTGILIRHGILKIWEKTSVATISMIPWEGIAKKHQSNGWQFHRDFKGPFVELRKTFSYFQERDSIYEITLKGEWRHCSCVLYPGDLATRYKVTTGETS